MHRPFPNDPLHASQNALWFTVPSAWRPNSTTYTGPRQNTSDMPGTASSDARADDGGRQLDMRVCVFCVAVAHWGYVWSMFFLFFTRALNQFHELRVRLLEVLLHGVHDILRDFSVF